jgi:hypothetical protein
MGSSLPARANTVRSFVYAAIAARPPGDRADLRTDATMIAATAAMANALNHHDEKSIPRSPHHVIAHRTHRARRR